MSADASEARQLPPNLRVASVLPTDHDGFDLQGNAASELQAAEDLHFWHRSRNRIIGEELLRAGVAPGAEILELGCGSGAVAAWLQRGGYTVTGIDGHLALLRRAAVRAPRATFIAHDLSGGIEDLALGSFDAIAFFDVLEHLDEPRDALRAALPRLRRGGVIVGTVPAQMSLWSQSDVDDGHRTRYDEALLEGLCRDAGLDEVRVTAFHRSLFPLLFAQRRLLGRGHRQGSGTRVVPPRPAVNEALFALCRAERWVERFVPWPGTSLFFAARRA